MSRLSLLVSCLLLVSAIASHSHSHHEEHEPVEISLKDIKRIRMEAPSVVAFFQNLDKDAEKLLLELHGAQHLLLHDFPKADLKVFYVAQTYEPQDQLDFKLARFPLLRLYDGKEEKTFDGRHYAAQISAFLKRHFQLKNKKVSAVLNTLEQFEKLEEQPEPFVIYCGAENSPYFKLYETVAADKKYYYYHTFESDFCTRLNVRRNKKEEQLFIEVTQEVELTPEDRERWLEENLKDLQNQKKHDAIDAAEYDRRVADLSPPQTLPQKDSELNQTIWDEHLISEPVTFIRYKPNGLFELLTFSPEATIASIKKDIEWSAISNFYTDFDVAYDYLFETKYANQWYMLFSPKNQTTTDSPCSEVHAMSKRFKLTDRDVRFGCLLREDLPKFGLEIFDENRNGHSLFYFSYFDLFTKKEAKISRPIRYKLDNPLPQDVEKFFFEVRAGKHSRHFVEEKSAKVYKKLPVTSLIRSTFRPWVEASMQRTNVAVLVAYPLKAKEEFTHKLVHFLQAHKDSIVLGEIDPNLNELDGVLEDDELPKLLLFLKDSDFSKPIKIMSPHNIDSLKATLISHIPELADLTKLQQTPAEDLSEVSDEDL